MLKKITALILIVVSTTAIYNLTKQIADALSAGNRLDQSVNELTTLQQENRSLKNKLSQVSQYDFIEKVARDNLGMSKPGETVVVIPQSSIDNVLGAEKPVVEEKIPNWQGWLKLIFH